MIVTSVVAGSWALAAAIAFAPQAATLDEALAAGRDLWGEAALAQPDGSSVEFFEKLLPPLRYVNTTFRCYPIVLAKPDSAVKARFVSDGSGVNRLAGTGTWRDDGLVPVELFVRAAGGGEGAAGDDGSGGFERFGAELARLTGPRLEHGWLPIVQLGYEVGGAVIRQEAFASVEPPLAPDDAVVFVEFGSDGAMEVAVRVGGEQELVDDGAWLRDRSGRAIAWHEARWSFDSGRRELRGSLAPGRPLRLANFTRGDGIAATAPAGAVARPAALTAQEHRAQRDRCIAYWTHHVGRSLRLVTGEPRVDAAWRALIAGTLLLSVGDTLNYSAGNLYEQTFEAECGDAVRALLLFGVPDAARFVEPLLRRPLQHGIELSDISYKLQLLTWHDRLLRATDPAVADGLLRRRMEIVRPEIDAALAQIEPETGLVPAQAYCGDVATRVHNLLANAAFWRGLRDAALALRELGGAEPGAPESAEAARLEAAAATLKERVLDAVARSERLDVEPPFVPIALFGAEQPYELLTQTMQGAYWNLIAPFVHDSGIFGPGSPRTDAMVRWQLERGGLCMGMVRFDQHSGLFANEKGVDDLYTLRLTEELLRRDDPDRALVSFHGKLAQGMTRDTFIGCEGSGLVPLDEHGRAMYLPPNGAANAFFLWTLRHLLVQDFDLDLDGRADTLRLLFATPRRWLAHGGRIELTGAPTMFGPVSIEVVSDLENGAVQAVVERDGIPGRDPRSAFLRLRLPSGFRISTATIDGEPAAVPDGETLELPPRATRTIVRAEVTRSAGAR